MASDENLSSSLEHSFRIESIRAHVRDGNPANDPAHDPAFFPEQAQEQLAHRLAQETGLAAERVETAVAVAFNQAYQGPIPSPQIVERLNAIQPGLGTRIVEDHLQQRQHDRAVDLDQLALEHASSRRADTTVRISGMSAAASFILLFCLVTCALYLAYHGHPELAGVFLAAPLVMVLGTLIPWSRGERPQRTPENR